MSPDIIKYKDYTGTVHFSAEDKVFFGKIFGINDLVTFEGENVDELLLSFREAVDDYLATCKQLNKAPEKSFKGSFNVRVPSEIHKDAVLLATQANISLNELIKRALTYAVDHPEKLNMGSGNISVSH